VYPSSCNVDLQTYHLMLPETAQRRTLVRRSTGEDRGGRRWTSWWNWRDTNPAKKTELGLALRATRLTSSSPLHVAFIPGNFRTRGVCVRVCVCMLSRRNPRSCHQWTSYEPAMCARGQKEELVKDSSDCNAINKNRAQVYIQSSKAVHGPSTISWEKNPSSPRWV
jgi:hypothetical protein